MSPSPVASSFTCGMTHSRGTWHIYTWHDSFTCGMTHSCITCLIHPFSNNKVTRELTQKICLCSHTCICLPASMHLFCCLTLFSWYRIWMHRIWAICDMTHTPVTWLPQVQHDSLWCNMINSCSTWLIHTWHDSFMCTTRFIHVQHDSCTRDMTHVCVTGLSLSCVTDSFICDTIHSRMTRRIHAWHDPFMCDMSHWCVTDSFIPYMYPYCANK